MKIAEIRELTTAELQERIQAEVSRYDKMVMNHAITPMENPSQIKNLRRTIARMKTDLGQREDINK
ncbi:MAG: 50S ribosomal protein L29 [Massilibacteroides sp.]|nr:50S ribosomal protein L29 [Massilibacteroides sp.]